jgi:hypothetical protein
MKFVHLANNQDIVRKNAQRQGYIKDDLINM